MSPRIVMIGSMILISALSGRIRSEELLVEFKTLIVDPRLVVKRPAPDRVAITLQFTAAPIVIPSTLIGVQLPDGKPKVVTNSIGMKFAAIPTGEFDMGAPPKEQDADASWREWPQRRVRISAFLMNTTEVSIGQFRRFVEKTGQRMPADAGRTWDNPGYEHTDQHPVSVVSWNDAVAFCNWLSRSEGLKEFYKIEGNQVTVSDWRVDGYRLPTEAEWEYACRAGTKTRFSCPEDELERHAWTKANSGGRAHPVGEKLPNKFGLFDMHGNVDEWCWDSWDRYPLNPGEVSVDPHGPRPPTEEPYRVDRGGTWFHDPICARSASRDGDPVEGRGYWRGFRVARNHSQVQSK